MLAIVLASWQNADGSFPRTEPIYQEVRGPPGCSIVILQAWRRSIPQGGHYFEGFARIYRIPNTGGIHDYRLFNFIATPCPSTGRLNWNLNCGFHGGDDRRGGGIRKAIYGSGSRERHEHEQKGVNDGRRVRRRENGGGGGELDDTADSSSVHQGDSWT